MTAPTRNPRTLRRRLPSLPTALAVAVGLIGLVLVPTAGPAAAASDLVSDDFSSGVLDPGWSVVDPLGDGSVSLVGQGSGDARLSLSVPGGSNHNPYIPNESLRVSQSVSDTDFEMVVKFDSVPGAPYQQQGILVEADAGNWLRFDVHRNPSGLRAYSAKLIGGSWTTVNNTSASAGSSIWLQVTRSGDAWTYATSADGVSFSTKATFSQALGVTKVGVFGGNFAYTAADSPAYAALVDYVFNTASPISPEDPTGPDSTPPVISNVVVAPAAQSATVTWDTNESASSEVDYGLTAALELPAVTDPALVTSHSINLAGLTAETTYSYEVTSTDGSNNTTTTAITTFTTPAIPAGPQVDLWYGDTINIGGAKAVSQRFANVLGNVSDPSGIAFFTASLNGGAPVAISHDPNFRRLLNPGDFNVDILLSDLQSGSNTVVLTATSNTATTTIQPVTINYTPGAVGFSAQTIDWAAGAPDVVAQPIDGNWTPTAGGVRTADPGYDRLLGIGDVSWTDYEVTVGVTVNSYVAQPGPNSGDPAVGMLLRWNGHNATLGTTQPLQGFVPDGVNPTPLGGYPLFRNNNFELRDHYALVQAQTFLPISLGVTSMMKARVETLPDGSTVYSTKTWAAGTAEPVAYQLTFTAGTTDNQPPSGAIVLLAHEADVTFGNVTITPLP